MPESLIKVIETLLPEALAADRRAARQILRRLKHRHRRQPSPPAMERQLDELARRLTESAAIRRRRSAVRSRLTLDAALPITDRKDDIIAAIRTHPVVIVSGETGSGKTTQIPKFCLAAGRGLDGRIGCTQPRRIAATSVARRIAEELGEKPGQTVGHKIRFQDHTGPDTLIKIMTDGILLAEVQQDRDLVEYDTLIVDEAHERSLNIDFVLGLLKTLLKRRRDLKLIVTSATIDTVKFSQAFDDAPVIEVSGRTYPVEVIHLPDDPAWAALAGDGADEATHVEMAVAAVRKLRPAGAFGDILVFMPTEQDIRETCEILEGDADPGDRIMPLFARLSAADQARVFTRLPGRKIIVATNVAETSITIPGIRYVVDTGLARISQYNPRSRTTALPVVAVSRSSADQRKGRCGRVENGVCIRLFCEDDYLTRPLYTPPEILRSNLAEVMLRMAALRLGDVAAFPFIDPPAPKSISDGTEVLIELGAVTAGRAAGKKEFATGDRKVTAPEAGKIRRNAKQTGPPLSLTRRGELMARLPVDPRLARMLIEARKQGCLQEVTVIAAALSIQDPRERPAERAEEADRVHSRFVDPASDYLTLINIWDRYHEAWQAGKSAGQMKKYCRDHFLSFRRMREWRDIRAQLAQILAEHGFSQRTGSAGKTADRCAAIHKAVLSGFLSNIAVRKEKNVFRAAKGREVMIFPGSALFNRAGDWIVAAEMVETSRLFARMAANIDRGWLEKLGGDLCRSVYLNPRWDARRGEVVASEQVSLFGLEIVSGRSVSFGRIDPETAGDVFVRSALVDGDVERPPAFLQHNQKLIRQIRDMEDRFRRRDILVDTEELVRFYRGRLPTIYDLRTLNRRIKAKGGDGFLRMQLDDLMNYQIDTSQLAGFPDDVKLGESRYSCRYRFDPGHPADGVTVNVPTAAASTVPFGVTEWLVPGFLKEKIEALLKNLPKPYRKQLVPIARTAEIIAGELDTGEGALISALGRFIHRRFGVDIPASAWSLESLPEHLKMRIAITGVGGEVIRSGRDRQILMQTEACALPDDAWNAARRRWEKTGITQWDFGDLPESIEIELAGGRGWPVFPGLTVVDDASRRRVDLKLFRNRQAGAAAHEKGVEALFRRHFSQDVKFLEKSLALPYNRRHSATHFGGARDFENKMRDTVSRRLFRRNIRTREAFNAAAREISGTIVPFGRRLLERVLSVVDAYGEIRATFQQLSGAERSNVVLAGLCRHLQAELDRLVPPNFMDLYEIERLEQLPRYIGAIGVRARRAAVYFEKDRSKADELEPFTAGLERLLQTLTPASSPEKRRALEEFHWLIEEFKVSLFAQELRTAVPVSPKRLREMMAEIERMG